MKLLNFDLFTAVRCGDPIRCRGIVVGHVEHIEHDHHGLGLLFDAPVAAHDADGLVQLGVETHHGLFEFGMSHVELEHVLPGKPVLVHLSVTATAGRAHHDDDRLHAGHSPHSR